MYTAHSSPDELLHAYIDDELDAELEPQLFSQLADDADLRSRLRQLRGLRLEARRFGAVSEPPPELTLAVFDRLGFVPSASKKRAGLIGTALLFRQAWAPVASAAAAAFLTATIIFGLQGTLSDSASPVLADRGQRSSVPAVSAIETPSLPAANTRDPRAEHSSAAAEIPDAAAVSTASSHVSTPANAIAPTTPNKPGAARAQNETPLQATDAAIARNTQPDNKATAPASTANNPFADHESSNSAANAETTPFASANNATPVLAQQGLPGQGLPGQGLPGQGLPGQGLPGQDVVDTRKYFSMLDAGPGLNFFSVELRGVSAASFPNVTIGTRSDPWMANMAVAVYYGEDQDDFGVEYGQEPFSQHYSGIEFGKAVRYEQNLLTSWLLAGYRHRFTPMQVFGSIEPYFSTSLGATLEAWPLARAGMGIMYMPDRRVRFQLGLEGSVLAYPYQDKWFTSKRAGLTYGISVLL